MKVNWKLGREYGVESIGIKFFDFFGLILVLLIWFGRFDSNFEIVNMSKVFFSEFSLMYLFLVMRMVIS